MIKVIVIVLCVFVVPGVVMGVISSYRAGQRPHVPVYLSLKKFAHKIFNQHTHRHVRDHWQWYLLITGFILVALGY